MTKYEAERQRRRQALESKRLAAAATQAERGGDELDRGGDELDRGGDELDRGGDELDRGPGGIRSSGGSREIAMDVFGRLAALGGNLSITFETPIGASSNGIGPARSKTLRSVESDAAAIDEAVTSLIREAKERRAKTMLQGVLHESRAASRYASPTRRSRKSSRTRARNYKSKA